MSINDKLRQAIWDAVRLGKDAYRGSMFAIPPVTDNAYNPNAENQKWTKVMLTGGKKAKVDSVTGKTVEISDEEFAIL